MLSRLIAFSLSQRLLMGILSLALLAVVLKIRNQPPPRSIMAVALIAAAVPLVALFW